jgi:two-component system response regulator RegA
MRCLCEGVHRVRIRLIAVLTGYGRIATAVEAMRLGARDYLTKPTHADRILSAFETDPEPMQEMEFEVPTLAKLEREHIERVLLAHEVVAVANPAC